MTYVMKLMTDQCADNNDARHTHPVHITLSNCYDYYMTYNKNNLNKISM